jgi:serine/threonine protein kinase
MIRAEGKRMPSLVERLLSLTPAQMEEYRSWTDAYESAWGERLDPAPSPDAFLPAQDPPAGLVLVQNVKVALEYLARDGTVVTPEDVLGPFSRLAGDEDARVEVLAWGSRLADAAPGSGVEAFSLPSLADRFPTLRDAIVERRSSLYREQGGAFPPELVPEGSKLLHELPRGGMSRLALIWNEGVGREEVLKIIDPIGRDDPEAVERFRREFHLAGDRAGSRVVPVYRAGVVLGHLYYAMPHLRGGSLRDRLRKGAVPLKDGVRVLSEVARSVHALHTQQPQLIHRDLKPENLLFSGPALAEPWIVDLGLARLIAETADPGLTGPGTDCLGTPGYMAPEQIRDGGRKPGPPADVHALGAILYELLTGRPPFFDASRAVALRQTQEHEPLRPSGLATRPVPADLEVIALKALRKDPAARFRTAQEFADELDRWSAGLPIRSRPPSVWTHIRSTVRRYPRTSVTAAAAVHALVGLSVLSLALFLGERAQKRRADRTSLGVVNTLHKQAERVVSDASSAAGLTRDREESLRDIAQALEFVVRENAGVGSPELGTALNGLAVIDLALGRIGPALDSSQKAERVFAALPPTFESRFGMAAAQLQTGRLLFRDGRAAEGEARTREAAEMLRTLVAERPDDRDARFRLGLAEVNLGNFARGDHPEAAKAQYRRALEQWEVLCRPENVRPPYLEWYARALGNLGLLMAEKGEAPAAVPILTDAVARAEHLVRLQPEGKGALDNLAACRTNLGVTLATAGRAAEAIPALNGALQVYEDLARRSPDEPEGRWNTAMARTSLADALSRLGRWGEALLLLEAAGATFEEVRKRLPDDPELKSDVEKHRMLLSRARQEAAAKR